MQGNRLCLAPELQVDGCNNFQLDCPCLVDSNTAGYRMRIRFAKTSM